MSTCTAASVPRFVLLGAALTVVFIAIISGGVSSGVFAAPTVHIGGGPATPMGLTSEPDATVGTSSTAPPELALSISAEPHAICAFNGMTCSAGAGESRVTLTAQAPVAGGESWPDVQVAFVLDTSPYNGDYDPYSSNSMGLDPCGQEVILSSTLCEESNGIPFFVANAQTIANAIQSANPKSAVSFALVDYYATLDAWDDGDAPQYHVDVSTFVPASDFGSAVSSTFQATQLTGSLVGGRGKGWVYPDMDLDNAFLASDEITALYGAIIGSGLTWSDGTHHVLVVMGDGAPRAPGYEENYCVSPSEYNEYSTRTGPACDSGTCEPVYVFGSLASPSCEGWTTSQDGNPADSIAALTRSSPTCTDSVGGSCTIDAIDYYDGITDPYSAAWPTTIDNVAASELGGGPGGPAVIEDSDRQLLAGCAIASATGGNWDGPDFFTCPDGQSGTLQYVPHGAFDAPTTTNPTLMDAFQDISFGPVESTLVATGTQVPMFSFVPYGNVQIAPSPQFRSLCVEENGVLWQGGQRCPAAPTNQTSIAGERYVGWNWSDNQSQNAMYLGESWSVSFWVVANGPPYSTVPIDACVTVYCEAGGSTSVGGVYSAATYIPSTNGSVVSPSFPLGTVQVVQAPSPSPPPNAPGLAPSPPTPGGAPTSPPPPIQSVTQVGAEVPILELTLQATAVGFLVGSAVRVQQANRPMSIVNYAGKPKSLRSKFDSGTGGSRAGVGRFE
ncbi:MAG: hypothetical protein L3K03_08675 [Thermoplasmata archaeon]|nr:hypothetical protein [Thermoplasmata archaeon]